MQGTDPFQGLVFSRPPAEARRDRFRSASGALLAHAVLVAVALWLTLPSAQAAQETEWEQVTYIQLEPEPPPVDIAKVEPPPVAGPAARPQTVSAAAPEAAEPPPQTPQGFQTLAAPDLSATDLPPPGDHAVDEADFTGEGVEGGRAGGAPAEAAATPAEPPALADAPRMVLMTRPPRLLNERIITALLEEHYPRRLQQARSGGTVLLWIFINTDGRVLKSQVRTSSGEPELDEAAQSVAARMRFSPPRNEDGAIQAWIVVPLVFQAR
jgi:periplasmic protein TonB